MGVKRGIPDIKLEISFLCTRVTKSSVEDKSNLKQGLKFLKQTINDKRVMGAENLIQLYTWVDATYGVHPNLKIHTSGGIAFLYKLVHCKYSKQKLNTKVPLGPN